MERHLTIPGDLEKVPDVCAFVVEEAEAAGLDERAVYHCQMAVDEWCTNVIEHGCCDFPADEHQIRVACLDQAGQFTITIVDDGLRFDPTSLAEVNPAKPLEEREPGGLGWFFIRKLMDHVHYEFKDGRNRLTMIKYGARLKPRQNEQFDGAVPVREWRENVWILMPSGRLDSVTANSLEATLSAQIEANHVCLIVDMSGVIYISSGGLKVLVSAWRKLQKRNGMLLLAGLTDRVREVFEISGFNTLFTLVANVDEAVVRIGPAQSGTP